MVPFFEPAGGRLVVSDKEADKRLAVRQMWSFGLKWYVPTLILSLPAKPLPVASTLHMPRHIPCVQSGAVCSRVPDRPWRIGGVFSARDILFEELRIASKTSQDFSSVCLDNLKFWDAYRRV